MTREGWSILGAAAALLLVTGAAESQMPAQSDTQQAPARSGSTDTSTPGTQQDTTQPSTEGSASDTTSSTPDQSGEGAASPRTDDSSMKDSEEKKGFDPAREVQER